MGRANGRIDPDHARTDLRRFGPDECRLSAGEPGFGAFASGTGAVNRCAPDGFRILEAWLIAEWQLEHRAHVIERHLLDVSAGLRMVKGLLADVPGGLLAIDPGLIVSQVAIDPRPVLSPGPSG